MESLMKADIFFFITTIIVVIWGIIGVIIGVLIIAILSKINAMTKRTGEEVDRFMHDFSEVRQDVKAGIRATSRYTRMASGALSFKKILGFLFNAMAGSVAYDDEEEEVPIHRSKKRRRASSGIRRRRSNEEE